MLQWMHKLSTSWAASLLMGVLALSFVVWGIADVFTGMGTTALATVGASEISQDNFLRSYRNFTRRQSQELGTEITPEMAQKMGLANTAIQQLISRTALDNIAKKMGLTTTDPELVKNVHGMQVFQAATGQFDKNTFQRIITSADYTEAGFLEEMRADMTRQQLTTALEIGFTLPRPYAAAIYSYAYEKRAVEYVIVAPEAAGAIAAPTDAVLDAYVKAHPERFSTPEYRDIEFARIGPADVANPGAVTEEMIAAEYATRKNTYVVAEKRTIQQIEFADEAQAKAARAQIDSGKSFDALAVERKMKPADLTLGDLTHDDLGDPLRADAAFALNAGDVSQPIKTALGGYVLLRVTAITPGSTRTLDQVREELRSALSLQVATGKLSDAVNAFVDASSGGANIEAAAKKANMKYGKFAAIDRNGLLPDGTKPEGAPADPEFLNSAFTMEVGDAGDPFAAKSGENYVLKINGVTPPKLKSLDQVRADAITVWTDEQRKNALTAKTAELAKRASTEKSLTTIARELKVPVQQSPGLARNSADTTFSSAMLTKIFAAPAGGIVQSAQGVGANFIIARVTGISHQPAQGPEFDAGAAQLSQQAATDFSVSFATGARQMEGVKVNQQMLQTALGQQ